MISDKCFLEIIESTPLISIDLILENQSGMILLGKRMNRPAQGYWFVPGGRVTKNERLADAIERISSTELGVKISISEVNLLGAFEHIYDDNYFGEDGVNTHYVVLAYIVKTQNDLEIISDNQHSEIKWWSKRDLLKSHNVHQNTKTYFIDK